MQTRKKLATMAFAMLLTVAGCSTEGGDSATSERNVKPAEKVANEGRAAGPLPDAAFKATITLPDPPATMQPGQKATLNVKVKNTSTTAWPSRGRLTDGFYQVNLGDIWSDGKGVRIVTHPYVRSGLPNDLQPGQEAEVPLAITAPSAPGDYTLTIDLVQEMVSWFSEKGNTAPKFKVKVGG
jgi:hypothetical protein